MIELGMNQNLGLQQTLEMMLSPRMIQMLKILNLSYADLIDEISQKTEENVMLEVEKPDRLLEFIRHISDNRIQKKDISGEDLPGVETLGDTSATLEEHLMQQLEIEDIDDRLKPIAIKIVESLDERGYLPDYTEVSKNIIEETGAAQYDIDEALLIVQSLEPEGVGARDLKECLLIQIREYNFETPELEDILNKVVNDHLEPLAKREFEVIAKALKITKEGVAYIAEFIKTNLRPDPASIFIKACPCVVPSFFVKKEKGKYTAVNLEKQYGPSLKISPQYEKMLRDPKTDADTVKFLREKMQAAKDFLETLDKRHGTIEKIVARIIDSQAEYLDKGVFHLTPLMQKNLADELGVHPSTISRALSNKYLQTPNGVISLKYLCPRDVKGHTSESIKNRIYEIIQKEDKKNPLSDEDIAQCLSDEGLSIKRRTVASYREKLKIDPASKRVSP